MNILKLAKNLKEFTLDEIEMLAEIDCKMALKQLLNERKIEFKNGIYKYVEKKSIEFRIFTVQKNNSKKLLFEEAVQDFLEVKKFYKNCENRNLKPRRIKNVMALLNQLVKYFQNQGLIDRKCIFQVKRLTDKTKFSFDRIVFDEERY